MKKIIAIALALVMCLGIMSMVAFAANDKMTVKVEAPAEWAECYVYSWTPDLFGGWPGTKLTNGSFELSSAVEGLVIGAGDGKPQTVDIKDLVFTAGGSATIKVGAAGADGKHTYTIEYPTPPTTTTGTATTTTTAPVTTTTKPPVSGNRTLTIKAPAEWTAVYVYTWEPNDFGATFPGSEVKKSGDKYQVSVKNTMVNLIVTGKKADGTLQQTADIQLETNGKNVLVDVAGDATFKLSYDGQSSIVRFKAMSKAAATKTTGNASAYRVVGGGAWLGDWNPASDLGLMNEVEPGLFRKNFENVQPGNYELKITKDGKWDVSYGDGAEGKDNCKFTVSSACTITVDLTIKDGVGYIELYGIGVDPSFGDISMLSVVVLMALASVTAIVLVVNRKKFI